MSKQHVRFVLCDRNHPDPRIIDGGPLHAVGLTHRTLKQALRCEKAYLKCNSDSFIARVTYERVKV